MVDDVAGEDLRAVEETISEMDLQPFDFSKPTGFDGAAEALKGLLRPAAAIGRTAAVLGGGQVQGAETLGRGFDRLLGHKEREVGSQTDPYFQAVDEIGSAAVDYWTPDPVSMGSSARVLNLGTNVVGSIPFMFGTPALFLASSGVDPAAELVRDGVDLPTAAGVGAVNLAVNAAGFRLPAAFGSTLPSRLATGAGSNLVLGAGADKASSEILEAGGYEQQAESYDATDPYTRGLDLLMGLAFGAKAHVDARLTPTQRDAVLVASNASHYQRESMPGTPAVPGADIKHQQALDVAIQRILEGERVDVSTIVRPEDFMLAPALRAQVAGVAVGAAAANGAPGASYAAYRRALESGGQADARNPSSSAVGADQFTAGTWRRVVAASTPAWAEGLSDAQVLAARTDPGKSAEMAEALDAENTAALRAAGQDVSHHTLYAAHHFGAEKGVEFAKAGPDTPMADILTPAQLKANRYLRGKTKAEAIANWDERAHKAGVDMDTQRTALVTDQAAAEPPRISASVAGDIVDARLATLDELAGAGRLSREEFTALRNEEAELVDVLREHEERQRSGVIPAEPRQALTQAEIQFIDQRRGEIRTSLELDRTAAGYERTAKTLRSQLEKLPDRDQAFIEFAQSLREPQPTSHARRGEAGRTVEPARVADGTATEAGRPGDEPSSSPREPNPDSLDSRSAAVPRTSGQQATSAAMDQGAASTPRASSGDRATSHTDALQSARDAIVAAPDLRIPTGELDADGNPKTVPATEVLAQAEAELRMADIDAAAVQAAANCFLRNSA
ncbi:MAG TPA: hypothetical protein VIT62_06550 [Lysobacter sp.]